MERFTRQPGAQAPQRPAGNTPTGGGEGASTTNNKPFSGKPTTSSKLLVAAVITVSIAVVLALSYSVFKSFGPGYVKTDKYQAVFLQNGQVYFGKLSNIYDDYVQLRDIYYLQVQQQVQPNQTEEGQEAPQQQPQVSLAKLGNELHGPEDLMFINREHIVFWENLKEDGRVTQAIKAYLEGQANGNDQNQTENLDQPQQ